MTEIQKIGRRPHGSLLELTMILKLLLTPVFLMMAFADVTRAASVQDLIGKWSVSANYESDPDVGGLNGSSSFEISVQTLRNGTTRISRATEDTVDSLMGFFSSDRRTVLDLAKGGKISGSTKVNGITVERIKGTWRETRGRLEATLYSSSRNGKRVTAKVTIRKLSASKLVTVETLSDGLTVTTIATRQRAD